MEVRRQNGRKDGEEAYRVRMYSYIQIEEKHRQCSGRAGLVRDKT